MISCSASAWAFSTFADLIGPGLTDGDGFTALAFGFPGLDTLAVDLFRNGKVGDLQVGNAGTVLNQALVQITEHFFGSVLRKHLAGAPFG